MCVVCATNTRKVYVYNLDWWVLGALTGAAADVVWGSRAGGSRVLTILWVSYWVITVSYWVRRCAVVSWDVGSLPHAVLFFFFFFVGLWLTPLGNVNLGKPQRQIHMGSNTVTMNWLLRAGQT